MGNGNVRMEFSAETGRVLFFGPVDGENLLWLNDAEPDQTADSDNDWKNFGGDKVWPGPQALWPYAQATGWPPNSAFDGTPVDQIIRISENKFTAVFPASREWGVQLRRTFVLHPELPELRIVNCLTCTAPIPVPVQIWAVTQIPAPSRVWFAETQDIPVSGAFVNLNRLNRDTSPPLLPEPLPEGVVKVFPGEVVIYPAEKKRFKLGAMGNHIAAQLPSGIFVQSLRMEETGMYPEASSLQYLQGPRYGEMETLSPGQHLAAGEKIEMEVIWRFFPGVFTDEHIGILLGENISGSIE